MIVIQSLFFLFFLIEQITLYMQKAYLFIYLYKKCFIPLVARWQKLSTCKRFVSVFTSVQIC